MALAEIGRRPLEDYQDGVNWSRGMAQGLVDLMGSFLTSIKNDISIDSNSPNVYGNWPGSMGSLAQQDTTPPTAPALATASVSLPTLPALDAVTMESFTVPGFSVPDPAITIPAVPTLSWPTSPGDAPALDDVTTPSDPAITLPAVPTFTPVSIPNRPEYHTVDFDGVRPDISIDSPGSLFVYSDQPYASDLVDQIADTLLTEIRQGGTGLGAEAEGAMWDRARNRLREDLQAEIDRVTNLFAATNCSRPSGPMVAAIGSARKEYLRKLQDLDRDILVQQSELAHKQAQFIINSAVQFETMRIDFHNKTMQRTLEAAKALADTALAAFDAEVKKHNLQLEQYKTDAQVFEAKIRANLATLEQYKTMIEAAKLEADIQQRAVDVYVAQLKGVQSLIEIYKAQMEGARIKSEIQVQRLTAYKTQVEAYASRVNANVARYNAYSAQVAGEKAKADVYATQVSAYDTRVKAFASQVSAESERVKALIEGNKSKVEQYNADVKRYQADVEAVTNRQMNQVRLFDASVNSYSAGVKAVDSYNDTLYKQFTSQVDMFFKRAQSQLEEVKQELTRRIERAKILTEAAKAGAQQYGQAASAAFSTINTSARIGYDESVTNTASEQASVSA